MTYRFLDHTADVGADLAAPNLAGLYVEAAAALADTITERQRVEPRVERRFRLAAGSPEALMVDWLEELLFVFEVDGLLFRQVEATVEEQPDGAFLLAAVARGEERDLERHPHKVLVKAVTWHALHVTPPGKGGDGWTARVIFDI